MVSYFVQCISKLTRYFHSWHWTSKWEWLVTSFCVYQSLPEAAWQMKFWEKVICDWKGDYSARKGQTKFRASNNNKYVDKNQQKCLLRNTCWMQWIRKWCLKNCVNKPIFKLQDYGFIVNKHIWQLLNLNGDCFIT